MGSYQSVLTSTTKLTAAQLMDSINLFLLPKAIHCWSMTYMHDLRGGSIFQQQNSQPQNSSEMSYLLLPICGTSSITFLAAQNPKLLITFCTHHQASSLLHDSVHSQHQNSDLKHGSMIYMPGFKRGMMSTFSSKI